LHIATIRRSRLLLDVRMLWLSQLTMRDGMNVGLNSQRQKSGHELWFQSIWG